jgi:hypothetical protein
VTDEAVAEEAVAGEAVAEKAATDEGSTGGAAREEDQPLEEWDVPEGTWIFPALTSPVTGETELALQRTSDGGLAVAAYTDLDEFVAAFGRAQRWLAFDALALPALLDGSGVTRIFLNAGPGVADANAAPGGADAGAGEANSGPHDANAGLSGANAGRGEPAAGHPPPA